MSRIARTPRPLMSRPGRPATENLTLPGPDLVCYNCAAIASGGKEQTVWVWEITTEGQDGRDKARQLQGYVDQLKEDPLVKRFHQDVEQGPAVPAPAGPAMVNGLPNQVVTVRSSEKNRGLELYQVTDTGGVLAKNDRRRETAERAYAVTYQNNKRYIEHYRNLIDPVRAGSVKDDPVTGWALAIGIGVVGAGVCYFLCPEIAAGGGAAAGVEEATPLADEIEQWLAEHAPVVAG